MTVQYLLNCVTVGDGGPPIELAMDGACGPKTMNAIDGFQSRWFSFVDGRVDPNGQSMGALIQFDPAPQQSLPPAGGAGVKNSGKSGGPGVKNVFGSKSGSGAPGVKNVAPPVGGKGGFGFKGG